MMNEWTPDISVPMFVNGYDVLAITALQRRPKRIILIMGEWNDYAVRAKIAKETTNIINSMMQVKT